MIQFLKVAQKKNNILGINHNNYLPSFFFFNFDHALLKKYFEEKFEILHTCAYWYQVFMYKFLRKCAHYFARYTQKTDKTPLKSD